MTVKQAWKECFHTDITDNNSVKTVKKKKYNAMYDIAFEHPNGNRDETEFDIRGYMTEAEVVEELDQLFKDFCEENGFQEDSVISIRYAGPIR